MSIGDPITQPIPAVGTAGPTYATQLVAFMNEVKTRLEAKVPLTSLLISDLDMANSAFQNVQSLGLYNQVSTPTSPDGSLQVYDDNLWFVSTAGAFQVTNGASLNASSLGGITGDYGSPNPAEFRFVDADKTYYAYDDFGGGAWANLRARYVELAAGATSAFRARLAFGGGASYTMTLPAAVPAAANVVTMDASGNLLNNGVLGANQNITLSGTGYVKTGARAITQPLILADLITGDVWTHSTGAPGVGAPAGGGTAFIPLKAIPDGARITGVTVYNDFATAGVSVVYTLHVNTAAAGGNQTNSFTAAIAGTSTTSTAANVSVAPATPFTPNTGQTVWLKMVAAAAGTPPTFISMAISYDRP